MKKKGTGFNSETKTDGHKSHCFAGDTRILMVDRSQKNIQDVSIGDEVFYMDVETQMIHSAMVVALSTGTQKELVRYRFESGLIVTTTHDRPFRIQGKQWASLHPDESRQYKGFEKIDEIHMGDSFVTEQGTDKLIAIDLVEEEQRVYTISRLTSGNNFIANGLIVGTEEI